jgi:acetyl esterase
VTDVTSTLDPDAARVLEMNAAVPRKPVDQVPPAEARAGFRESRARMSPDPQPVADVADRTIPGPGGAIPVRIYRGRGTNAADRLPAYLYFHGGGWSVGDLDTHDVTCRQIANDARCAVVAVDYRLAPENPFPAAVDDAEAALTWLAAEAAALGVDGNRIAVGGDSSGGNLAAVTAIAARERGGPALRLQVLVYPVVDLRLDQASYVTRGSGYTLSSKSMRYYRSAYVPDPRDWEDWRAAPLRAPSLRGLPPAIVVTAGHDPLCDEGTAYAERLRAEGVAVDHRHYAGQMHGFVNAGRFIRAADQALGEIAAALQAAWR